MQATTPAARESSLPSRLTCVAVFTVMVVVALLIGSFYKRPLAGLSIDDGYIYLQYAKNLAEHGVVSFNLGPDESMGATSYTWTLLLAGVHKLLGGDLAQVAQLLGTILLGLAAAIWVLTLRRLGANWLVALFVGAVLVTDPFLIENALSGMDTGLNLLVFSGIMYLVAQPGFHGGWAIGGMLALSFLTRPDNFFLLPALGLAMLFSLERNGEGRVRLEPYIRSWARAVVLFGVVVTPFLIWAYWRTGSFVPPTRIGKMLVFMPAYHGVELAEFQSAGIGLRAEIAWRCIREMILPFLTTHCRKTVILPLLLGLLGLPLLIVKAPGRRIFTVFVATYVVCLSVFFSLLFPLVKDRYLINFHPVLIGSFGLLCAFFAERRASGARGLYSLAPLLPLVLAASALGNVVFVERYRSSYLEQVANHRVWSATGSWVAENAPGDTTIALEPIGAVKYASQARVLDMGGLVTTVTWPIIRKGLGRNYEAVHALMREQDVDFVVDHYPHEWLGGLATLYPEHYRLAATIEPTVELTGHHATDVFQLFATSWGCHGDDR